MNNERKTLRNKELENILAGTYIDDKSDSDNLAIALCSYFERHQDRPENDPPNDENPSWGVWVIEKQYAALRLLSSDLLQHRASWDKELEEAREERDAAIIKYTGQVDASEQAHKHTIAKVESLRQSLATAERERDEARKELQSVRVCFAEASHRDCQAGPEIEALKKERDEAREACAVKDKALSNSLGFIRFYRIEDGTNRFNRMVETIEKALAPTPGAALVERLRKAEEEVARLTKRGGELVGEIRNSVPYSRVEAMNAEIATLHDQMKERHENFKTAYLKVEGERNAALSRCRKLEGIVKSASPLIAVMEFDHDPSRPLPRTDIEYRTQYHDRAADWLDSLKALSSPPQKPYPQPVPDPPSDIDPASTKEDGDEAFREYIAKERARMTPPEQKSQTVPREIADGLAEALEAVSQTLESRNNYIPMNTRGKVKLSLAAYRAHSKIGGRVE